MAYIANWLAEEMQSREAILTIDDTLAQTLEHKGILEQFMPIKIYNSYKFVNYVVEKIIPLASVVAYGGDIPNETFGNFRKLTGNLFKGGLQFEFDEQTQIDMKEAIEIAELRRIGVQDYIDPYGNIVPGANNGLAELIFGSISTMTEALMRLLKVHSWTAVQYGVVNYVDPLTGARHLLDYRDPEADYGYAPYGKFAHFPEPLTGTARWTEYATANGLQDLTQWRRQFYRDTGRYPDAIVLSDEAWDHLKYQESTRQAYASVLNTNAGVVVNNAGVLDDLRLEELFKRLRLPQPLIMEEMYWTRDPITKKRVKRRYLNQNRIVFLNRGMGEQAMGPTMENDGAAGPYVVTREVKKFPPIDAITGVASMLPILPNPKLLFAKDVFDAA